MTFHDLQCDLVRGDKKMKRNMKITSNSTNIVSMGVIFNPKDYIADLLCIWGLSLNILVKIQIFGKNLQYNCPNVWEEGARLIRHLIL